jgi:cbb3-type cytochrome c oxidase subunit III
MRLTATFSTLVLALFASLFSSLAGSQAKISGSEFAEPASAAEARSLYARHCSSCHGGDGRSRTAKGRQTHARNIADSGWQNDVSDERIFNSINNGRGAKMPKFEHKLSESQIDQLVTYVRQLKK